MEKWKTKSRFPTFPPPRFLSQKDKPAGGQKNQRKEPSRSTADFQAHLALESKSHFRLIPHWNQFSISGSFLDWKMLHHETS
jgi:hypothetical protein